MKKLLLTTILLATSVSLAAADAFDEAKGYKPGVQDVPMVYKEIAILWPGAKKLDTVWLAELQKHASPGLYAGMRDIRYPIYGKPDKDKRKRPEQDGDGVGRTDTVPEPLPIALLGIGLLALGWGKRVQSS